MGCNRLSVLLNIHKSKSVAQERIRVAIMSGHIGVAELHSHLKDRFSLLDGGQSTLFILD